MGYNDTIAINGCNALTDVVLSYQPVSPTWGRTWGGINQHLSNIYLQLFIQWEGDDSDDIGDQCASEKTKCGHWDKFYLSEPSQQQKERINQQLLEIVKTSSVTWGLSSVFSKQFSASNCILSDIISQFFRKLSSKYCSNKALLKSLANVKWSSRHILA